MAEQGMPPTGGQDLTPNRPAVVVVVPPAHSRLPMAPFRRSLPAIVADRLPALWDGGRGPLAQAVVAGGLFALGSVVGRLAANEATIRALVPSAPPAAKPTPPPPPSRTAVIVETAIVEARSGRWGRRTKQVQLVQQRVTVVQD